MQGPNAKIRYRHVIMCWFLLLKSNLIHAANANVNIPIPAVRVNANQSFHRLKRPEVRSSRCLGCWESFGLVLIAFSFDQDLIPPLFVRPPCFGVYRYLCVPSLVSEAEAAGLVDVPTCRHMHHRSRKHLRRHPAGVGVGAGEGPCHLSG